MSTTGDTPWISPRTGKVLSPTYQRRLARAGVTAEQYRTGSVALGKARGHKEEARLIRVPGQEPVLNPVYRPRPTAKANAWISKALEARIDKPEVCKYFSTYPRAQQEEAARTYLAFTNPTEYAAERARLIRKRYGDRPGNPQQMIYTLMQIQMNTMQVPYVPGNGIQAIAARPVPLNDVYHNYIYFYIRGEAPAAA